MDQRIGLVNPTPQGSFLQLKQFISVDYGSERPSGLRDASMGKLLGFDWFMDQNMATLSRGDVSNGTNVMGASQTGTTLIIDNGSGTATGTINEGTRFTINALALEYVVTADTAAAGGSFSLPIYPALESSPADNAAITYIAAVTGNVMYTKNAIAAAIVPPAPLAVASSIGFYNGVGIRVTMSSSTSTLADDIVFDCYCGAKVIEKKGGICLQG